MKIGEIKAQALRLMFAAGSQSISPADTDDMLTEDANAAHYLIAMTGSINRALGDIERRRVIRPRSVRLDKMREEGGVWVFDTEELSDFLSVDHISLCDGNGYDSKVSYVMDGTRILLPPGNGVYTLFYRHSMPRLTSSYGGEDELQGVPDRVAALIPYYIKADLFSEDEPGAATEARNWYEAGMAVLTLPEDSRQDGMVVSVFSYPGGIV